jgi:type VI secretion system Hcp family effector
MGCVVRRPLLAAALAATAVAPAPAIAAVDIFIKLDDVVGESQDNNHKGWINVQSFDVGASVPLAQGSGTPTGRTTCSPFHITKVVDKASPTLFTAAASGGHYNKGQLDVQRHDGNGVVYLKYELQDVFVSSVVDASDTGDTPMENVTFNFGKINVIYTPQNPDGSAGDSVAGTVGCR